MQLPARYAAARKALAEAVTVIAAKDVRAKAMAIAVYAFQAKDSQMAGDCAELKARAERRIGQMMADAKALGELKKGRPKKGSANPNLEKQGVDKNLAKRCRIAWSMEEKRFEVYVTRLRRLAFAVIEGQKELLAAAREEQLAEKKTRRATREKELAEKVAKLPDKKYSVVLADPEWDFKTRSEKGKLKSAENHYPTSTLDVIKSRDVRSIAAKDCVLFLWATVPMLQAALDVMEAWGFNYVSNYVWYKDKHGTGYWNKNIHEHLLIGTKGKVPAPAPGEQYRSVIEAGVRKHSQKPDEVLLMIEKYFPNQPKIELNRRGPARKGWDAWGNEAET